MTLCLGEYTVFYIFFALIKYDPNTIQRSYMKELGEKHKILYLIKTCFQLFRIYAAPPTAELEPLADGQIAQTDEVRRRFSSKIIIGKSYMKLSKVSLTL